MKQKSELHNKQSSGYISFKPYSELDITVEEVSQGQLLEREGLDSGICGGLSVAHILSQLKLQVPEIKNPFKEENTIKSSIKIQNDCDGEISCLLNELKKESSYSEGGFIAKKNIDLRRNLKEKIQYTLKDKKSRGIFIGFTERRSPESHTPLNDSHALSMTIQENNEKIYCTGMDSNMFFAKGEGVNSCNKIAEKMAELIIDYEGEDTFTYTVSHKSSK